MESHPVERLMEEMQRMERAQDRISPILNSILHESKMHEPGTDLSLLIRHALNTIRTIRFSEHWNAIVRTQHSEAVVKLERVLEALQTPKPEPHYCPTCGRPE